MGIPAGREIPRETETKGEAPVREPILRKTQTKEIREMGIPAGREILRKTETKGEPPVRKPILRETQIKELTLLHRFVRTVSIGRVFRFLMGA
jgi:hypothetical protein